VRKFFPLCAIIIIFFGSISEVSSKGLTSLGLAIGHANKLQQERELFEAQRRLLEAETRKIEQEIETNRSGAGYADEDRKQLPRAKPSNAFKRIAVSIDSNIVGVIGYNEENEIVAIQSGVSLAENSVISAWKRLRGAKRIAIVHKGLSFAATVNFYDENSDLVIIGTSYSPTSRLKFGSNDSIKIGQKIFLLGYTRDLVFSFQEGIISEAIKNSSGSAYKTTIPFPNEFIGGGVFDSTLSWLGSADKANIGGESIQFVWSIEEVKKLVIKYSESQNSFKTRNLK